EGQTYRAQGYGGARAAAKLDREGYGYSVALGPCRLSRGHPALAPRYRDTLRAWDRRARFRAPALRRRTRARGAAAPCARIAPGLRRPAQTREELTNACYPVRVRADAEGFRVHCIPAHR